jgi:LacI family transcriptional regulator
MTMIGAIYNVGGGNPGFARALAEMDREQDVVVVVHEITFVSVPLLANGTMNYVLSQNPRELLSTAMSRARVSKPSSDATHLIDFGVFINTIFQPMAARFISKAFKHFEWKSLAART